MRCSVPHRSAFARRGFTVLELMLSIAIMTVIFIGLYTVFDQTQKALRQTISQVDVLEGIRTSTDLVGRDIESFAYVPLANYTNLYVAQSPYNLSLRLDNLSQGELLTTVLQDVFFHQRQGDQWTAVGYWVGAMTTNPVAAPPHSVSVGRLYRFSVTANSQFMRSLNGLATQDERNAMLSTFQNLSLRLTNSAPLIDGVVHFRMVCYGESGAPLFGTNLLTWEQQFNTLKSRGQLPLGAHLATTVEAGPAASVQYLFSDHSYPTGAGWIEYEIGILEPQLVKRYASIAEGQPAAAAKYLERHAGQIHLFRQRVPLRATSPY